MSVQLRPVTPRGRGVTAEHDWLQPSRSGFESWRPCHADEAQMDEHLVADEEVAGSKPAIRSLVRTSTSRPTSSTAERLSYKQGRTWFDSRVGHRIRSARSSEDRAARFYRDGSQVRLLPRGLVGWKLSPAERAALNREAPGSIPGHPIVSLEEQADGWRRQRSRKPPSAICALGVRSSLLPLLIGGVAEWLKAPVCYAGRCATRAAQVRILPPPPAPFVQWPGHLVVCEETTVRLPSRGA